MAFGGPRDYIPCADYDGDGEVDDFEMGLFMGEMEEEDKAIMEGRAFFGSAGSIWDDDDEDDDLDIFDDDDDSDDFF